MTSGPPPQVSTKSREPNARRTGWFSDERISSSVANCRMTKPSPSWSVLSASVEETCHAGQIESPTNGRRSRFVGQAPRTLEELAQGPLKADGPVDERVGAQEDGLDQPQG